MDFSPISNTTTSTAASTTQQTKAAEKKTAETTAESTKNNAADTGVIYEKGSNTAVSGTAYKTSNKNAAVVEQMKADAAKRTQQLQSIVHKMISQQGQTLGKADSIWSFLASGNFTVDAKTKAQAQADIAEDGYWGVNQTSDRIVDFAKALSGGDPDKADELLEAVKKGFQLATKSWGREMPKITQDTYDAVQKKFDEWKNSDAASTTEAQA